MYLPQYFFFRLPSLDLSPVSPSFMKCKVLTTECSLIIVLLHISQDIASPVTSALYLEAQLSAKLSWKSSQTSQSTPCLGQKISVEAPSSALGSPGLKPELPHCLFPSFSSLLPRVFPLPRRAENIFSQKRLTLWISKGMDFVPHPPSPLRALQAETSPFVLRATGKTKQRRGT